MEKHTFGWSFFTRLSSERSRIWHWHGSAIRNAKRSISPASENEIYADQPFGRLSIFEYVRPTWRWVTILRLINHSCHWYRQQFYVCAERHRWESFPSFCCCFVNSWETRRKVEKKGVMLRYKSFCHHKRWSINILLCTKAKEKQKLSSQLFSIVEKKKVHQSASGYEKKISKVIRNCASDMRRNVNLYLFVFIWSFGEKRLSGIRNSVGGGSKKNSVCFWKQTTATKTHEDDWWHPKLSKHR